MFIKNLDDFVQKFENLIPDDGTFHDVQICNDKIFVDGQCKNDAMVKEHHLHDENITQDQADQLNILTQKKEETDEN